MKVAICGAPNSGAEEIYGLFMQNWPMYTHMVSKEFERVKNEDKLSPETLDTVMNELVDLAMLDTGSVDVVNCNCVLDALARTFLMRGEQETDKDNMIMKHQGLVAASIGFYDIIFLIPMSEQRLKVQTKPMSKEELMFSVNVNSVLCALYDMWSEGDSSLFPFKTDRGCPPIIKLGGTPEECATLMKLYINKDGKPYDKNDSLIAPELLRQQNEIKKFGEYQMSKRRKK